MTDEERRYEIAIDLVEEYWKKGCECKQDSPAQCNLCRRAECLLSLFKRIR